MHKAGCLLLSLLWVVPLWSQVEPSASGGGYTADDETRMITPPPVSGEVYKTRLGSEAPQNELAAGLVFTAAYNDNLFVGTPGNPTSDETYSVLPTIRFDRETPRQLQVIGYSAGFTLYQHTSDLNSVTQTATANYQYHLTKYASLNIGDQFSQNSNAFNQPNPFSPSGVPGGTPTDSRVLLLPFENQITNTAGAALDYQYARNAMIGGGGSYSFVRYKNAGTTSGLFDSDAVGATFFYTRRLTPRHYLGALYRYSRIVTSPVSSTTDTDAVAAFYTFHLSNTFTFSVIGGPQYYSSSQPPHPETAAWTPSFTGSAGYRTVHLNIAANYTRIVTGGGALLGAYHSNTAGLSARRLFTRTWSGGVTGAYQNYSSATPVYSTFNQGGHSWTMTASVQHTLGERINAEAGYSYLHQSYAGIPSADSSPDGNRVYFSITYQYTRPLGR